MKLTDWLGNEYGPGDLIIYPVGAGRSIEMQQATVVDIWTVYQCPSDYNWKRLKDGQEVPTKEEGHWDRSGERPVWVSDGHKPVRTERRVRLQPNGKGSREFYTRKTEEYYWLDPDGNRIDSDKMYAQIEAEHGPRWDRDGHGWIVSQPHWHPEDFDYSHVSEPVLPKAVTLTLGIDNITLLKKAGD